MRTSENDGGDLMFMTVGRASVPGFRAGLAGQAFGFPAETDTMGSGTAIPPSVASLLGDNPYVRWLRTSTGRTETASGWESAKAESGGLPFGYSGSIPRRGSQKL